MDYINRSVVSVQAFCRRVIEWRSAFSIPYVLIANALFWVIVFHAKNETKGECLLGISAIIVLWDILLSPTHSRSVASQILHWPVQDLFRTVAFVSSMASYRQLGLQEEEQAFWLAALAVACLLLGPVYKYNKVTSRAVNFGQSVYDFIRRCITVAIVNPTRRMYEAIKYVVLLKWMPGLVQRLRRFGLYLYDGLDYYCLQYVRSAWKRTTLFFNYWIYFHWWTDLKAWSNRTIYQPVAKKLAIAYDHFVYIFGGYWFVPALKAAGRQAQKAGVVLLGLLNQAAVIVTNSILWPVAVLCFEQVKQAYWVFHAVAVQPVIDEVYGYYRRVENLTFIYLFGPVCQFIVNHAQKVIDVFLVPFKQEEVDPVEIGEFIPETSGGNASESELSSFSPYPSDDEEKAFYEDLQAIAITDSDSENDEFSLSMRKRPKKT